MSTDSSLSSARSEPTLKLGSLLSAVALSSVVAYLVYGTALVFSGTVSLGYFPVILGAEALAAGLVGILMGILAFFVERGIFPSGSPAVRTIAATIPFAIVWVGVYFWLNSAFNGLLFAVFLILGPSLFALGVFLSRTISSRIAVVLSVTACAAAVLYPWVLAMILAPR